MPRMATACFLPHFFLFLNNLIVILFALKERLYISFSLNWVTFYDCFNHTGIQRSNTSNVLHKGSRTLHLLYEDICPESPQPPCELDDALRPSCCEEAQTITCIEATCTPRKTKRCPDSSQMLCFSSSHQLTKTTQEILNQNGPANPFSNF